MTILQFSESLSKYKPEILALLQMPDELFYEPDLKEGDTVNVFNHEDVVQMTVYKVEGAEFTLIDECGFLYLASSWRWTEDLGVILRIKTSMRGKKTAGWTTSCCCQSKRLTVKKVA